MSTTPAAPSPRRAHPMRLAAVAAVLLAAAPASAQKEFGFDNQKPSGQPYLTPQDTVAKFTVAPEFEVKLFAAEPDVVNPVAFSIDEKGRVWVLECYEYPSRTPPGRAPRDRIVILEDTDGDGAADKRTVFAEGKDFPVTAERKKAGLGAFDLATGLEVGHGGVFVGAPPYLWFVENKGDKPGKIEPVLKGFGSEDTHETLNTFQWGPDGWLYGCHGVFTRSAVRPVANSEASPGREPGGPPVKMDAAVWRYHPKTRAFEKFAEGTSNPWGLDWRNTDGQFVLACCVIPHLFHVVPGGVYKRQAGASSNPHAYGEIAEICDHTFHRESGWAHAGLISLDAPHIPAKYRDSVIFGSIHGCSLKRNVLRPNGSTYTASRADDFLKSGDKNVRPINLKWGPLGDIYLIDWHDQNPCHQARPDDWDYARGRVYRIQLKGTEPRKADDLSAKSPAELAGLLRDDNPYRWRTALRLLAELPDADKRSAAGAVGDLPPVRAKAARQALGLSDEAAAPAPADSPAARRELASAAVRLADKQDVTPLLHALMKRAEDADDPVVPFLTWLAYEKVLTKALRGGGDGSARIDGELAWLASQAAGNRLVRDRIVPRAVRRLASTGRPAELARCVRFVAGLTDGPARGKALDGMAQALQGRTVPPPAGWVDLQPKLAADPKLAPLADRLAVSFRDPKAMARAVATANDAAQPAAERAEAVRQLAALRPPQAVDVLLNLATADGPPAVRAEAVRGLAGFDHPAVAGRLLGGWAGLPPAIRAEAVGVLAGRKAWAKDLLNALAAGTVDRTAVGDTAVSRIEAFADAELTALVASAWGRTRPTPAELTAQIDKMRAELAAGPGSLARGKLVFEAQCGKCHKFDGRGAEVGPALDGAARDIEYILANVMDPNRVIGAPYFQRIVRTVDGRVEQGLLHAEDDSSVTLKVENGVLKRFDKADLDEPVKTVERSVMPEGLTNAMSAQDFRDLVRYLTASPFVGPVAVDGTPTPVPVTGRIPLPAAAAEAVVEAAVTAADAVKTTLLVSAPGEFTVSVDGKPVGSGRSDGGPVGPDRHAFPVELSAGPHVVAVAVKRKPNADGGVYVRLLDPDRKLTYPEK